MSENELLVKLLKAELEEEVIAILQAHGMDNPEAWLPYGGMESNYSVIGNQSSTAERSFGEKKTNAIDALFMRKCYSLGIDPKGPEAPKNPEEALEIFYGVIDGDPRNITKKQEEEIMNDLWIMATTKDCKTWENLKPYEKELNLLIYDGGEGQSPKKLPETILSLLASNKSSIPFTQGNFNQGGSGALRYCGKNGYCLVVSRRHPDVVANFPDASDETEHKWGWTLIREELRPGWKNPVYTYYAPGGKIPSFTAKSLPLKAKLLKGQEAREYLKYDKSCSAGVPYSQEVEYGTLIKLYNYNLTHKGPLLSHYKYDLSKCIFDTYLPIKMVDCRKNKFNNDGIFRGLKKLLEDDLREPEERRLINKRFPVINKFTVNGQEVKVTVYGLNKRGSGKKDQSSFLDETKPILLTLGQQIQGTMDSRIISNAGLGIVKKSLLIIIEFPNITPQFKKDLFMTDRERLVDKEPKKIIQERLKNFLKDDETIKEFCAERMQNVVNEIDAENIHVKSAVEQWLENNPQIKDLLGFGRLFSGSANMGKGNDAEKLEMLKREKRKLKTTSPREVELVEVKADPTFFEPILRSKDRKYYKEVKHKQNFKIEFRTDSPLNFFDRPTKKGSLTISLNGVEIDNYSLTLKPGRLSLYFDNKVTKQLGNQALLVYISCPEIGLKVKWAITLKVEKLPEREAGKGKGRNDGSLDLPFWQEVTIENGPDEITEDSGVILDISEEGEKYFINVDNRYLKQKLEELGTEGEKVFYKRIFVFAMLFNAIATKNYENGRQRGQEKSPFEERVEMAVAYSTASLARTFFLTEQLTDNLKRQLVS